MGKEKDFLDAPNDTQKQKQKGGKRYALHFTFDQFLYGDGL